MNTLLTREPGDEILWNLADFFLGQVPGEVDSPGSDPVWQVHGEVRCLELRRSSDGAFYLWSSSLPRYDLSPLDFKELSVIFPQE